MAATPLYGISVGGSDWQEGHVIEDRDAESFDG